MSDQPELTFNGAAGPAPNPPPAPAAPAPAEPHDELFAVPAPPGQPGEPAAPAVPPPEAGGAAAISDGPLKALIGDNFIRYASYVIRDRAIPDIDDGLKPVQRRILHALHLNDDGKFVKVANIVGFTMQFHPHGDASIGDALVTLANKRFLIEGQGNFGNLLTGDPAAAARYIECRLTELARTELFNDDLTECVPTYDGRREEPVSLPAKIPLLLMLGADGIAVGLSTRILPHNFSELVEAQIAILSRKPFQVHPDFPQGGLMDVSGYDNGRGAVRLRARIERKDAQTLVIREIPAGSTTDSLISSIEDAARRGTVKIRSISDFTSERVEIEIQLQPEQDAEKAVDTLYAFTQCEVQMASRIVVIRDRKPAEMTVEEILRHNTERLQELLRRELRLRQKQLAEDLHRRTLVELFIEQRVYQRIESCRSSAEVAQAVHDGLAPFRDRLVRDVTHADVEMLLGIPIRRISQFDLEKNRHEMGELRDESTRVEKDLAALVPYAIRYLRNLLRKHGGEYPRRTEVTTFGTIEVRELTATELRIAYDREKGYLGFRVTGDAMIECSSYDKLLLFWRDGRCRVVAPPEKLFVDTGLLYCAVVDRERVFTVVYAEELFTYAKRFSLGGTVTNREYRCAPKGAEIRLLSDAPVPSIYVIYAADKAQAIRQQEFPGGRIPVRDREARGVLMTSKRVASIGAVRPPEWDPALKTPKGSFMNFV